MFKESPSSHNLADMMKPKTEATRDLSEVVNQITESLLAEYNAEEQKEILSSVIKNITNHYHQIRQQHVQIAEESAKSLELFNFK